MGATFLLAGTFIGFLSISTARLVPLLHLASRTPFPIACDVFTFRLFCSIRFAEATVFRDLPPPPIYPALVSFRILATGWSGITALSGLIASFPALRLLMKLQLVGNNSEVYLW